MTLGFGRDIVHEHELGARERQTVIYDGRALRVQPLDVRHGVAACTHAGSQPELQRAAFAREHRRHAGRR